MVSAYSSVVAAKEQVSSGLAGEAVILDVKSGVYYGLNEVGAWVWNLIQEAKTVSEIRESLLAKYEVEPEQWDREPLALLEELADQGLMEVRNEAIA